MKEVITEAEFDILAKQDQDKYNLRQVDFGVEIRLMARFRPVPKVIVSKDEAVAAMETVINYIAKEGRDTHTEGTAERFINAWDRDWGEGYEKEIRFTVFKDDGTDQMVVEMGIPIVSHCSHHLAPIMGVCHIAYLPSDKIVGLSKLNRIVEKFARRLQVQERMTTQIADELQKLLEPRGVGVQIIAEHFCVSTRGVRHHGAKTVTTKLTGLFLKEDSVKVEFLDTINTHGRS